MVKYPYDMQIAGHAISTARHLVTHNSSEFSRIERLHWEDWKTDQRWKDKPKKSVNPHLRPSAFICGLKKHFFHSLHFYSQALR